MQGLQLVINVPNYPRTSSHSTCVPGHNPNTAPSPTHPGTPAVASQCDTHQPSLAIEPRRTPIRASGNPHARSPMRTPVPIPGPTPVTPATSVTLTGLNIGATAHLQLQTRPDACSKLSHSALLVMFYTRHLRPELNPVPAPAHAASWRTLIAATLNRELSSARSCMFRRGS